MWAPVAAVQRTRPWAKLPQKRVEILSLPELLPPNPAIKNKTIKSTLVLGLIHAFKHSEDQHMKMVNDRKRATKRLWALSALALFMSIAPVPAQETWADVSQNLFGTIENYDSSIPGARGIGGIAVDRHSGDLIAVLNGPPWGVYRSSDAGQTWERIDDGSIGGGWIRSFSIQLDQDRPGRMAFFRASPPAPDGDATSGMTLDGGKTWIPFEKAKRLFGIGGWVHGMVDWSEDTPSRIVAQSRVRPNVCLSTDGGKKLNAIKAAKSGIIELTWNHEYIKTEQGKSWQRYLDSTLTGYGISDGVILLGRHDSIELSEDGKEFTKVSDFVPTAHTPVRFDGKLYWGAQNGVIVSADKGKTWTLLGSELPMVRKGPFFGSDANSLVVVSEGGVYRSADAGANWSKISELYQDADAWRADLEPVWLRHDYAWDHTRNLLYVAGMAGSCYKKEVK